MFKTTPKNPTLSSSRRTNDLSSRNDLRPQVLDRADWGAAVRRGRTVRGGCA